MAGADSTAAEGRVSSVAVDTDTAVDSEVAYQQDVDSLAAEREAELQYVMVVVSAVPQAGPVAAVDSTEVEAAVGS